MSGLSKRFVVPALLAMVGAAVILPATTPSASADDATVCELNGTGTWNANDGGFGSGTLSCADGRTGSWYGPTQYIEQPAFHVFMGGSDLRYEIKHTIGRYDLSEAVEDASPETVYEAEYDGFGLRAAPLPAVFRLHWPREGTTVSGTAVLATPFPVTTPDLATVCAGAAVDVGVSAASSACVSTTGPTVTGSAEPVPVTGATGSFEGVVLSHYGVLSYYGTLDLAGASAGEATVRRYSCDLAEVLHCTAGGLAFGAFAFGSAGAQHGTASARNVDSFTVELDDGRTLACGGGLTRETYSAGDTTAYSVLWLCTAR